MAAPPAGRVPRWPASVALIAIAGVYLILSQARVLGPRWLIPGGIALLIAALVLARMRRRSMLTRILALGGLGGVTLALFGSVALLLAGLAARDTPALLLLRDAALIWGANVLTFALWYWEIDGGGPAVRHRHAHQSDDFIFPQMTMSSAVGHHWSPDFLDYLFLAFNTSTAFSPTDTLVLSRHAKVLMMIQSLISLVVLVVLAARAVNTL